MGLNRFPVGLPARLCSLRYRLPLSGRSRSQARAWLGFQGADASRGSWATPGLCWAVWPSQLFSCCFLVLWANIPARDQAAPPAINWRFQNREEAQGVPLDGENGVLELRKEFWPGLLPVRCTEDLSSCCLNTHLLGDQLYSPLLTWDTFQGVRIPYFIETRFFMRILKSCQTCSISFLQTEKKK